MDSNTPERNIQEWDEHEVHIWLSSLGFSQYEPQIKEHSINGEVLCMLNQDTLKAVGVSTVGQRLAILKAVYLVKIAHNVPIQPDDYVPPSEASERFEGLTVDKLHVMIKDQGIRLHHLEEENRHLNHTLQLFVEDFNALRNSLGRSDENPSLRRQPSFKWAQYVRPQKSPTKPDIDSPHPSPQQLEHDLSYRNGQSSSSTPPDKPRGPQLTDSPSLGSTPAPPKTARTDSSELKSFKVSLEDPTWKVLPAALKKYRINNDNWENYAMFICYGSTGNRIERCLSYDEKPLLLFQKLKDAKKNPVFMLKHIKDIRSPIAVAQQKHAARKASSIMTNGTATTSVATLGHTAKAPSTSTSARTAHRPPRLEVDLSASGGSPAPGIATAVSPTPGWPELGLMSPAAERSAEEVVGSSAQHLSTSTANTTMSSSTLVANSNGGHESLKRGNTDPSEVTPNSSREMPPVSSSGISYAVAIYPYMAEQEDEFDVVVGDTFIILSRARGWWVVQRDPTGSGVVDADIVKQGWVPAGCLLETNVPVASAIAEATAAKSTASGSPEEPPETPVSKTPILPLSIISTSFPGIALMDYKKKGEEELDLVKDDALRVFKRYNHWSYAVKEEGGDRGWVPSWFIGKVATGPATPNTSAPPLTSSIMDDANQAQVSPMSSAFPAVQSSRSVAVN
ncbi:protein kinase regulator [Mycena maculata]|uniref:Protein kinase regulator n=1 Tax=Mycena maculata TaxID=230809 RepID=A0AAD7IMY9_9AGAR|nr:protein kinase regulator [Mycena maculata]